MSGASMAVFEADRQARLARPLKTFRLSVDRQRAGEEAFRHTEDVQAATWEVAHGTLIFRGSAGEALRALAPGAWSEVRDG